MSAIRSLYIAHYKQNTTSIYLGASFNSWETDSAGPGDVRQPKHRRTKQMPKVELGLDRDIFSLFYK